MSQTLIAHWEDSTSFQVPEGIDLRDTKNVCWYVRWNTLYIETKDGRKFEIEGEQPQLKRPESCHLEDDDGDIDFNDTFDSSSEEEETDSEDDEKESVDCCHKKVKSSEITISSENTKICPDCWT